VYRRDFLKGMGATLLALVLPKNRTKPKIQGTNGVLISGGKEIPVEPQRFSVTRWQDDNGISWYSAEGGVDWANSPDKTVMISGYVQIDWSQFDKTCGPILWEVVESDCDGCLPDSEDLV